MKEVLAAYTAALNRYDFTAVENLFAENAIYMSSGFRGELHGRVAIMTAFRAYFAEHTNQVNEENNVRVIGANLIQSDWSLSATNSVNGKFVQRKGTQVITFNNEGRIALIQVLEF